MCQISQMEQTIEIVFTLSEAKALLEDDIGSDAFDVKLRRFRQKLRRAIEKAEDALMGETSELSSWAAAPDG